MNKITEKSYILVPDVEDNEAIYTIKLTHKPWVDIVVQYGKIGFSINEDQSSAKLSFKYSIVKCPDNYKQQELEQSKEFQTFLGDLLSYIIQEAFDSGNYTVGEKSKSSDPIDVQSTTVDDPAEDRP